MVDAAQRTDGALSKRSIIRFHPAFQRVFDIVRSGRLHDPRVDAAFDGDDPLQAGGELRHTLEVGGSAR